MNNRTMNNRTSDPEQQHGVFGLHRAEYQYSRRGLRTLVSGFGSVSMSLQFVPCVVLKERLDMWQR